MPSTQTIQTDIVMIGSGAAGLAAAVTAAHLGARVHLIEKSNLIGGTSAWSGGWIWCPGNPHAAKAGYENPRAAAETYLRALLGNHFDPERTGAFLDGAPEMVGFFETNTSLAFDGGFPIPDTYGHLPGAGLGGRSVIAKPFDGRKLGRNIRLLRRPLRETSFRGMTIQAGADLRAFMTLTRSFSAFRHVTKRVLRHVFDLAFHGREMDLRNGNALTARLLHSALEKGVTFRLGTEALELLTEAGRVSGVLLTDGTRLEARNGVILATGGFPHAQTLPEGTSLTSALTPLAVPSATGGGLTLATDAGAALKTDQSQPAAFCPVSLVPWPDETPKPVPHIIERGKPGLIGVLPNGARFCNEGLGYHDYVEALLAATPKGEKPRSWLVCDHRFLRRYGLGIVRPAPLPWQPWARMGYLKTAPTIEALAETCGISPEGLRATVTEWNRSASQGKDPAFHRGTTPYMRLQGDPEHGPNPCVAPILKAPFFAVEVIPGCFGTFAGIATNGHAQALRADGAPIEGLYAAGADAASPFGGFYPAGGINLGPALTFGYLAARHAVTGT